MPGRKRDSVWLNFDEVKIESRKGKRAKCKECGGEMEGLTQRMRKHLEQKCPSFDPMEEAEQRWLTQELGIPNDSDISDGSIMVLQEDGNEIRISESEVEAGMNMTIHTGQNLQEGFCDYQPPHQPPEENLLLGQIAVTNKQILDLSERILEQKQWLNQCQNQFDALMVAMKIYVDRKNEETGKELEKLEKELNKLKGRVAGISS
jgi:hypothetical protein